MEVEPEINKNVCRLCDKIASKMFGVFEKNEAGHQIIQLIKEYLPIIIYRTDPLSKKICENCYLNLNRFVEFHKIITQTVNRQKEILKTCTIKEKPIQLYLSSLELDSVPTNGITKCEIKTNKQENKPSLCSKCRSAIVELKTEKDEVEMCAELHKAIADSLKKHTDEPRNTSRASNLRNKRKRNEGFYTEIDDSQESCSVHSEYTESTQRTESQSDTEMGDSDQDMVLSKRLNNRSVVCSPVLKKRCLAGPKSRFKYVRKYNEKFSFRRAYQCEADLQYNPLTLTQIVLNVINKENVSDYFSEPFKQSIAYSKCKHCGHKFKNVKLLALHEVSHMNIGLEKIDYPKKWTRSREDAEIRNKWLVEYKKQKRIEDEINGEQNLLVPVATTATAAMKSEIVLIDTKAYVNGVSLTDIPKDDRRLLYRNITIQGLKRKFCPLCRYTFKDNWAIESHYYSSACYFTCRYCGVRFNKQRFQFEEHVKHHVSSGHKPSNNIYAPRRSNGTIPKILNNTKSSSKVSPKEQKVSAPPPANRKVRPLQMKQLFQNSVQGEVRIKQEVEETTPPVQVAPTSQAYFCRKCYKVFYKLDEFNIHVSVCTGSTTLESKPKIRQNSMLSQISTNRVNNVKTENERYSSSGRPVRHCVKEITYKDEFDIDAALERSSKVAAAHGNSFECEICGCLFPSVHSRNSHMRIHKNGARLDAVSIKSHNIMKHRPDNYAKKIIENIKRDTVSYNNFTETKIKQEPGEPIVEIHEQVTLHKIPSSIGSVSITPIPSKRGTSINPNIIKLVQNNPHLTIKSMNTNTNANINANSNSTIDSVSSAASSSNNSSLNDFDKSYKCSSCGKPFANKSHLYFHKKNQCGGSKFPCPFCKKRFGTETAYSSHIFYSHPE